MKRKLFTRLLSVVLALTVSLGAAFSLSVYAAAGECNCGHCPTVYVTGISSKDILKYPGAENEETLFPPATDKITTLIKDVAVPLAISVATDDWGVFGDAFMEAGYELMRDFACNDKGEINPDTGIDWEYPEISSHGENSSYPFYYDWRLDVLQVARDLNDYVQYIKEQTGHSKVNLHAFSMGSAVTLAYFYQFGFDDVRNVVFDCPGFQGVSVCGMPFAGKIRIEPDALVGFVSDILSPGKVKDAVSASLRLLDKLGVVDFVAAYLNHIIEEVYDDLYSSKLLNIFTNLPGLWSLVPASEYEEAKAISLDPVANADIIKVTDEYHYNVQQKAEEIISAGISEGINFAIICKYNLWLTPVITDYALCGDVVIDTQYASGGAICADIGSTLGDYYTQAVDCGHNHLSADGMIDASSCMFPEYTWFVKDEIHFTASDGFEAIVEKLLASDEQLTVFSDPDMPQFLITEEDTQITRPLSAEDVNKEESDNLYYLIWQTVSSLIALI